VVDPLPTDCQIDPQPDPGCTVNLVDLFVLRLESGEPADRHVPGGGQHVGAMTGVLLVIPAKLAVGGLGSLLGDEAGSEATKRIGEGNGRLEDTKTEISWAHHSPAIPLHHPIGVALRLGEQAIAPDESRHRVAVVGALWGVHPEVSGLGHPFILAWL
jgi:hypothetical protein